MHNIYGLNTFDDIQILKLSNIRTFVLRHILPLASSLPVHSQTNQNYTIEIKYTTQSTGNKIKHTP